MADRRLKTKHLKEGKIYRFQKGPNNLRASYLQQDKLYSILLNGKEELFKQKSKFDDRLEFHINNRQLEQIEK